MPASNLVPRYTGCAVGHNVSVRPGTSWSGSLPACGLAGMGTIVADVVETGERRDTRGRRMTPAERRRQLVQAYRASGLTMAGFARRERINYATFAGWVAKASREATADSPLGFTEIALPFARPPGAATDLLEVRLVDGTVLRGSRVAEVAALVRALRS